jgi:integrase
VSVLALHAPAPPERDPFTIVQNLVDREFWAQAGWDEWTRVLTASPEHPALGWAVCRVPGCDAQASEVGGVCPSCRKAMIAAGSERLPDESGRSYIGGEGTCAVGCPRPWESRRRPLCAAHEHQRGAVLKLSIEEFLTRTDLHPLPGFGPCRVLACTRLRPTGKSVLCGAHQTRWRELAEPCPQLAAWCRTEPGVARLGEVSLRGLPDLVVAEILYGVQVRAAADTKTSLAVLRSLCDQLRRAGAASVADLPDPIRRQNRDLLRSLVAHARRAVTTPAEEQAKDVWDLGVFGYPGKLDFTVIGHRWLREATKRWVAEDLPRRRGRNAPNIWWYYINSLSELSTSLDVQRDDHGEVPARLGRGDIVAFANRLAFLQQSGQLSLGRRIDVLRHTRTVLTAGRWAGLTRRGQMLAGLPDDFALAKEDIPSKDRSDAPGRALPTEVMRQLCTGLEVVHETTDCTEARTAIELLIDTGRRPEEICDLSFDCLERDKDSKYVLVYDNIKCQRRRRELPITDTTARTILDQQQRVRQRFPDVPAAALKLLPAPTKNPLGTKAFRPATLNGIHRAWLLTLPPLTVRHGGDLVEFDKSKVFPYAYRHTYAQRHADAGVPVDVLRELLDHDSMDTTQAYYRVGAERRREAVDKVARHQFDRVGQRVWREAEALLEAEHARLAIGQVSVPYGICTEPTNVQAGGSGCPFRFRCIGCDHFRTDVSYLPDLTAYLHDLLRDRERLLAAIDLDEWAKAEALPSEQEISRIKNLIHRVKEHLEDLDDGERAEIDQAVALVRRTRRLTSLGMPRLRTAEPDLRLERA